MKRVLFVCTANVCRSPMAEAILNALAEENDIPLRAESAGVAALVGREIAPNTAAALRELGIYPEEHRARQLDPTMVADADLVLAMGPSHVARVGRLLGDVPENVFTLPAYAAGAPEWEEVTDPYGQTMTAHRATARQLLGYAERLVERFAKCLP